MMEDHPDATYVGRIDYGHPAYRGPRVFRLPRFRYYVETPAGGDRPLPTDAARRLLRYGIAVGAPQDQTTATRG